MGDSSVVESLIRSCVEDILCSSRWSASMALEEQKMQAKKRSLLLKSCKTLKTRDEGVMISIPEAAAMMSSMMGNTRQPR